MSKGHSNTNVTETVEDAASTALQMDSTILHMERIVSKMRKSKAKSKLLETLKHLNYHWTNMKAFVRDGFFKSGWANFIAKHVIGPKYQTDTT